MSVPGNELPTWQQSRVRSSGAAVSVRALRKSFGPKEAVAGIDLTIAAGSLAGLVGPNGAGKSTLMASISGLLRPRLGSITLDGADLVGMSPRQVLRLGVVQVPQNHSLFRDMTVRENIELGGYILSDRALVARRVAAVFDVFPDIA